MKPIQPLSGVRVGRVEASTVQTLKLGDLLVQQGVLTVAQRDQVLEAQRLRRRPFGVLAEDLFGVSPAAWSAM